MKQKWLNGWKFRRKEEKCGLEKIGIEQIMKKIKFKMNEKR